MPLLHVHFVMQRVPARTGTRSLRTSRASRPVHHKVKSATVELHSYHLSFTRRTGAREKNGERATKRERERKKHILSKNKEKTKRGARAAAWKHKRVSQTVPRMAGQWWFDHV